MIQNIIEKHIEERINRKVRDNFLDHVKLLTPNEFATCVNDKQGNGHSIDTISKNLHWEAPKAIIEKIVKKLLPDETRKFEEELFKMLRKQGEINLTNVQFGDSVNQTLGMMQKEMIEMKNEIFDMRKNIAELHEKQIPTFKNVKSK